MPTPSYMTVKGSRQGLISASAMGPESAGNAHQPEHRDEILVQAVQHDVYMPDATSGGHRMHTPLIITKAVDKTTPLLHNAFASQELLTECRLDCYRLTQAGGLEQFYSIHLEDAVVQRLQTYSPHCQDESKGHLTIMERVYFSYKRVRWEHHVAGTSGSDSWQRR